MSGERFRSPGGDDSAERWRGATILFWSRAHGQNEVALAPGLLRELGIAGGVIVNRADLCDLKVKEHFDEEAIPIPGEIPYDPNLARLVSQRRCRSLSGGKMSPDFCPHLEFDGKPTRSRIAGQITLSHRLKKWPRKRIVNVLPFFVLTVVGRSGEELA